MSYIDSYVEEEDDDFDRPTWISTLVRLLVGSALLPMALAVVMYFWAGRLGVEKALTTFAQPDGLLWCLLSGVVVVAWRRCDGILFALLLGVWLIMTVGGNSLICGKAVETLEEPYLTVSPFEFEEPFDYVVVLGGGTSYAPNECAQLNASGDRVMLAARLYLSGKAKHVICTGDNISNLVSKDTPSPGELTRQILVDLQIPEEDITLLKGRNTSEEMARLRDHLKDETPRVALVTSAWHMPRAMRLAAKQKLDFWAVPADIKTSPQPFTPLDLVPSTANLSTLGQVAKEWLAKVVGR